MIELKLNKTLNAPAGEMKIRLDLTLEQGSFIALYGPSGAGKTSVLRMLAGLMAPDTGQIHFQEQVWFDSQKRISLKPQKRSVGFLFQDYALFPNMSVRQNLEYALPKGDEKRQVEELIALMELGDLQKQKPTMLSGGQKQRVALARALVNKPQLLLLDEPLSAVDKTLRIKLQSHLLEVHRAYDLTTLLVTHDTAEVIKMADEVLILETGSIVNRGKPVEVFSNTQVSGKFQFTGEVLQIEPQEFVSIVSVLIGKDIVRIVAEAEDAKDLAPGDQVLMASKAFNPIIRKI